MTRHPNRARQFEALESRLALAAVPVLSADSLPIRAPGELTVVGDDLYFVATEPSTPYYAYYSALW